MYIRPSSLRPATTFIYSAPSLALRTYNTEPPKAPDPSEDIPPGEHGYGSVPHFEKHWTKFFANCPDTFELQRGLNNCFNYDLVPPAPVVEAALLASRRLNSFATGVRVFGGLRGKVKDDGQYAEYLEHFRPMMEASGMCTPEDLGRYD